MGGDGEVRPVAVCVGGGGELKTRWKGWRGRWRAKTDRKDVGKVERGGKNRSCTVKENREYANGL